MNDNAELYRKFLEAIMFSFASATGHSPTRKDMPQIRTLAAKLVVEHPDSRVTSVTVIDGVVTVGVEPPDEMSLSA